MTSRKTCGRGFLITEKELWHNPELTIDDEKRLTVEMIVSLVGERRVRLYGKINGCNKIHIEGGRVYGYDANDNLIDISLAFALEKYSGRLRFSAKDMAIVQVV